MQKAKAIVIGLCGKKQNGKSTFCNLLENKLGINNIQRINFKDPLLNMARDIGWDGVKDKKGRKLLQRLGTDVVRECIDQNYWVDCWTQQATNYLREGVDYIIADDVRFDNEALAIKALGGIVVQIETPSQNTGPEDTHKSEAGIRESLISQKYVLEFGTDYVKAAVEDCWEWHIEGTILQQTHPRTTTFTEKIAGSMARKQCLGK
jgi:NADPH:quinone reductase-like Zn-dependent oxidoreductase